MKYIFNNCLIGQVHLINLINYLLTSLAYSTEVYSIHLAIVLFLYFVFKEMKIFSKIIEKLLYKFDFHFLFNLNFILNNA